MATFFICVGVGAPNNVEAGDLSLSLRPEGHRFLLPYAFVSKHPSNHRDYVATLRDPYNSLMLKENQEQHPLRGVFVWFMSGFVSKTPSPDIKQTTAHWAVVALDFLRGGERGIRTLDTLLRCTHFPGALLKPLGHLSIFDSHTSFWREIGRKIRIIFVFQGI